MRLELRHAHLFALVTSVALSSALGCTTSVHRTPSKPMEPAVAGILQAADREATTMQRARDVPVAAEERRALGNAVRLFVENDAFALNDPSDQFYTNGLRLEWNLPPSWTPDFIESLSTSLPLFPDDPDEVSLGVFAGQSIYTPSDISDPNPRPNDRPYAGWLYGGFNLRSLVLDDDGMQNDAIHVLELQTGIVGPSSGADTAQTEVHEWYGWKKPQGWRYQLHDEFGLNLVYVQAHRLLHVDAKTWGIPLELDFLANFGGSLGNVHTNASAGAIARFGINLPRDFGVNSIQSMVGDAGQRSATPFYVFGGFQGRAVARNIFLDGNTWRSSPSVQREYLVGEIRGGAVLGLGPLDLSYTFVIQTPEFEGTDHHQQFGSVMLSYTFR